VIFIILGLSGSGKGTQARLLSQRLNNIPTISTGALLRIKYDENNPDGVKAERYWSKGKWVPDALMYKILTRRLDEPDCYHGFILDAFPRTLKQVTMLDHYLSHRDKRITKVIHLTVSDEEVVDRMVKRAQDDVRVFGKARRDENTDAIKERLLSHHRTIDPILDEYESRGLLLNVNGELPVGEIHEHIVHELRKEHIIKIHHRRTIRIERGAYERKNRS